MQHSGFFLFLLPWRHCTLRSNWKRPRQNRLKNCMGTLLAAADGTDPGHRASELTTLHFLSQFFHAMRRDNEPRTHEGKKKTGEFLQPSQSTTLLQKTGRKRRGNSPGPWVPRKRNAYMPSRDRCGLGSSEATSEVCLRIDDRRRGSIRWDRLEILVEPPFPKMQMGSANPPLCIRGSRARRYGILARR